nr:hypothetical protein [Tanacetum cinerariifolium]
MSRDVITVGSTMRIPLLYRGEYSQWREQFMNYLEEQTDGEAMINSIQNGEQPLPVIAQVSLAGNAQNAPPTLKDPKFWTAKEKKTRKIDRLARSHLIQRLPNDIYSLIDSNESAKDLCDTLERQMRGSEYAEQDRKAAILYEYETFKATEGEQLLDTYLRYLQQNQGDVNDALGYKKKDVVVTSDPLSLVAEKTKVSKCKEKVKVQIESEGSDDEDINDLKKITALLTKAFNRKKLEKKEDKRADEKKRDMSKVKCYNCKKEGHFAKDCKKAKVKDYNYYKTKMLLAKKHSDEQVLLAKDQAWMESSSDSDQKINEQNNEFNEQIKVLNEKNADLLAQTEVLQDQLNVKHVVIDTHTECQAQYAKLEEERYEYMIRYSALCDNDKKHMKKIDEQEILFDKMSRQLVEMNNNVLRLQEKILEKETKISELEGCVSNKDVEIEKCLERLNECENKLHKIRQTNQTIHMIMPSKDALYNGKKGIGFENPRYFEKAKDLRHSLYDEKVIGLGYTPMFLIHLDETLEIEKFKRARENKIEFAYDHGNLNATYVIEKINFSDDYFQEIINLDFEKIGSLFQQTSSLKPKSKLETIESLKSKGSESSENAISELENQSENDCQVVEKECDQVKNSKVIASGMFKLNLDTFSSVRRPKQSSVIWKKKGSSNTSNVDLSSVSHLKLNKDVKRYSRKGLLSFNNSHLGETSCFYVCNDAMNVSCNSRLCDSFDENNLFIFDDESVRISHVSKMPFRKKPCDYVNVRSKSNLNKSLPRTV